MRPEPKKRIATTGGSPSALGGLEAAFAGLNLPELPAGSAPLAIPVAKEEPVWKMGRIVLRKETAHRGGKTVIVVYDFATHLPLSLIETLAKKLRSACGCGGAVRKRTIEIQGEQAAKVRALLEAEGFQVAGVK